MLNRIIKNPLLLIVIGIAIGMALSYFVLPKNNRNISRSKVVSSQQVDSSPGNSISTFVNPSLSSSHYKQYNFKPITGLKSLIEQFIKKSLNAGEVTTISVYYRDFTNEERFGINEYEKFSPSSLLKVPIMIATLKLAEERPEVLNNILHYQERREHEYTGINKTEIIANTVLIEGVDYKVDRLVEIMIEDSDNEATILLINYLEAVRPGFLDSVQERLGLTIDDNIQLNDNFVSVRQYSSFFRTLYNASFLSEKMSEKALNILSKSGYNHGIRQSIPKEILVSHKFGDKQIDATNFQLHHFAIVYHPNKPFLLGIMTKGNDPQQLKNIIASLSMLIYDEIEKSSGSKDEYIKRDLD